jgi:cell wall-associated NlpC family hydrolase
MNADESLAWINDYVGVPYLVGGRDRAGWDCWGLVCAVWREQRGVELPDWRPSGVDTLADQVRAITDALADARDSERAAPIEAPEPWAFAIVARHRMPHHLGVVLGAGVLHVGSKTGGTVYDPMTRFRMVYPAVTWWRWNG